MGAYAERLFTALPLSTGESVPWVVRPAEVDDKPGWELVIDGIRNAGFERAARLVPERYTP